MNIERWDVLTDPRGEVYVVFGFPCLTREFITLLYGNEWSHEFIIRDMEYVTEAFTKIGIL